MGDKLRKIAKIFVIQLLSVAAALFVVSILCKLFNIEYNREVYLIGLFSGIVIGGINAK